MRRRGRKEDASGQAAAVGAEHLRRSGHRRYPQLVHDRLRIIGRSAHVAAPRPAHWTWRARPRSSATSRAVGAARASSRRSSARIALGGLRVQVADGEQRLAERRHRPLERSLRRGLRARTSRRRSRGQVDLVGDDQHRLREVQRRVLGRGRDVDAPGAAGRARPGAARSLPDRRRSRAAAAARAALRGERAGGQASPSAPSRGGGDERRSRRPPRRSEPAWRAPSSTSQAP